MGSPLLDACSDGVKRVGWSAVLAIVGCDAAAGAEEIRPRELVEFRPSERSSWYLGARFLLGASYDNTGFQVFPNGATGGIEDSYDPQESCGAEFVFGYAFTGAGLPLRAELSGGILFRHDADMEAFGLANPFYENNLRIWDLRASMLADVAEFSWGRLYVGAGVGAVYLDSDVSIVGLTETAAHGEWILSPSLQSGIIFDDVIGGLDFELAYRFRWFGDTRSGTFADNARLQYEDVYVHELLIGVMIPLGR